MPHLDLTYFFDQSLWCAVVFLLIYFTASRKFYNRYSEIIASRRKVVQDYIDESNKILLKAKCIKEQLENSKKELSLKLKSQEEGLKMKIYNTKMERLNFLKKELENRNLAHKLFLNKIKETLANDLEKYSIDIEEKISFFLFKEK